ncbi:hypothetical protein ALC56_03710, partial [Trachymyrmex septentrionalis]
ESKLSGHFLSVIEIGRLEEEMREGGRSDDKFDAKDRQETKMRMIEDPRTKTMTLGKDNVTNKVKLEASWKLFA